MCGLSLIGGLESSEIAVTLRDKVSSIILVWVRVAFMDHDSVFKPDHEIISYATLL